MGRSTGERSTVLLGELTSAPRVCCPWLSRPGGLAWARLTAPAKQDLMQAACSASLSSRQSRLPLGIHVSFFLVYWLLFTCPVFATRLLSGKESTCNARNLGLIPGSGRSPGGGHGKPLQYSCLDNHTERKAWWATVHGVENLAEASKHTHPEEE